MADIALMKKKERGFLLLYGMARFRPSNWSSEVTLIQTGYRASDVFKRSLVGSSRGVTKSQTRLSTAHTRMGCSLLCPWILPQPNICALPGFVGLLILPVVIRAVTESRRHVAFPRTAGKETSPVWYRHQSYALESSWHFLSGVGTILFGPRVLYFTILCNKWNRWEL